MKNNELLKKVCRYLNPYPQNLCLSLRPNPTGSTNRDFNVDDAIYEVLTMPREEITI